MPPRTLKCAVCDHEIEVQEHDSSRVYRCQKCSGILLVPGVTTRRRVPAGTRFGRFQLINVLARGPRSTVYRALDTEKLRLVALKQLGGQEFSDSAFVMEWVERTRGIVTFEHPSLVKVTEVGIEEGTAFLTMVLVEGVPLYTLTQTVGMALFPMLTALRDVTRAVSFLHDNAHAHGRVTGEHVIIGEKGAAVLVSVDGSVRNGDAATDMRALGKLLYESIVRQPAEAATPPSELGVEMQRDLEYLLVRAARCEYARAAELAADIERYLAGKPLVKDNLWRRLLGG